MISAIYSQIVQKCACITLYMSIYHTYYMYVLYIKHCMHMYHSILLQNKDILLHVSVSVQRKRQRENND